MATRGSLYLSYPALYGFLHVYLPLYVYSTLLPVYVRSHEKYSNSFRFYVILAFCLQFEANVSSWYLILLIDEL